jgi:hypothetical protein
MQALRVSLQLRHSRARSWNKRTPADTTPFYSYKVTKGLLDRFGDKRVIDSPITESGFCGLTVPPSLASTPSASS